MSKDASTADATRIPTLDDSRIQWRDATSAKGRNFRIGTFKPDDSEVARGNEADLLGPTEVQERIVGNRAKVGVMELVTHDEDGIWWPVGNSDWKTPTQRIIDRVDISRYYLTKNHLSYYDYILYITNTQDWNYTFYDESGDGYGISTYREGDHCVAYDSDKPNIVRVVATS